MVENAGIKEQNQSVEFHYVAESHSSQEEWRRKKEIWG